MGGREIFYVILVRSLPDCFTRAIGHASEYIHSTRNVDFITTIIFCIYNRTGIFLIGFSIFELKKEILPNVDLVLVF